MSDRNNTAYCACAKPEFEELAHSKLTDPAQFNASPIVSGGKLYLRSDQNLYCIANKGS